MKDKQTQKLDTKINIMKNLLFLIGVSALLFSCDNSDKRIQKWRKEYEETKKKEAEIKEVYRNELKEKSVDLSFMGFQCGASFSEGVRKAKANKDIRITKQDISKTEGSIEFRTKLNEVSIDCKICSFQDTITSLIVLSKDFDNRKMFRLLYIEKYGEPSFDSELFGDAEWRFKNGSIKITNHEHTEIKNGKEQRYYDMTSIIYNDYKQIKKVEEFERMEKIKTDSLNRLKRIEKQREEEEIKKKALEKI